MKPFNIRQRTHVNSINFTHAVSLLIVGIALVCCGCGPDTKLEGDTAKVHYEAKSFMSPGVEGWQIGKVIWNTAKSYPQAKSIEVTVEFTGDKVVDSYLTRQWQKISKSVCEIVPWDSTKTAKGIWYLTQNEDMPLHQSGYFHGEFCHWKMSTLLHTKILQNATQKEAYEN